MALWAAIVVSVIGVGMATAYVGLVIALPLIGFASWHAYRDIFVTDAEMAPAALAISGEDH